jgi:hypothetical protein
MYDIVVLTVWLGGLVALAGSVYIVGNILFNMED